MKESIIILIIMVVFLAGCTQTIAVPGNGLTITNFIIDPGTVESGEKFSIYMEIENNGGKTADNIVGQIYGINEEEFLKPMKLRYPLPSPTEKRPGGFNTFTWTSVAPEIPQGTSKTYDITGRLSYEYSASAVANILVLSKEEETRRKKIGISSGSLETSVSKGPIKISISGDYPVIVRNENGVDTAVYEITFENIGNGVPITNEVMGLVKGKITVSDASSSLQCPGQAESSTTAMPEDSKYSIMLRHGDSTSITCSMIVDRNMWLYGSTEKTRPQGAISLVVDIEYGYYIDVKKVLTVIQRKR